MARKQARRSWGSGSIKFRQDGLADLRWYENGARKKKSRVPGHLAKKVMEDILARIQEGQVGLPRPSQDFRTVNDWAAYWFAQRMTTNNAGDQARYELHIKEAVGDCAFSILTPLLVKERLISPKLRAGLGGATVMNCVRILSSMMSDAVEFGLLPTNPCKFGKKTRAMMRSKWDPNTSPWVQNPDDVRRVMGHMDEDVRVVFALGCIAGLRPGETRGLDWSHLDFDGDKMTIQKQVNERTHTLEATKSKKSRTVPMIAELKAILLDWWEKSGRPTTGLVVHSANGFIGVKVIARAWHKARVAAGLPYMRFYDGTRHTFGSHWLIQGGTRDEVKDILGHSSHTATDRYIHMVRTYESVSSRKLFTA